MSSWLGAILGISSVGLLHSFFLSPADMPAYIGSLGATAVLLYAAPSSPLARVKNTIGGHLLSALVGVSVFLFVGEFLWFSAGLAVATAILVMLITNILHPPGGATALISVIGSEHIHSLGYLYVICPVASGVGIMLMVAFLMDKIFKTKFVRFRFSSENVASNDRL
ncbi:MAG: HPP family protein [Desulfotalea sp.]